MLNYTAIQSSPGTAAIRIDWGNTRKSHNQAEHFANFVTKQCGYVNRLWQCKRVIDNDWAHTYAVDYYFNNPTDLTLILLKYTYGNDETTG